MELLLERCTIRSWEPEDAGSLVLNADNKHVWRTLRDRFPRPYRRPNAEAWIHHARSMHPETAFAIVVDGEAAGGIGVELLADVYRGTAEIGFWLGQSWWGRGIATEAVGALTDWAFDQFNLRRIYASVFESNPASARVMEKCGYILEATLRGGILKEGRVLDEWIYAMVREETFNES